jgi:hypothetical protein
VGVVKSCGCTNASLDKQILGPGEKATLACTYNLKGRAGKFGTAIDVVYCPVTATTGKTDALVLAAYANVIPRVRLSDEQMFFEAGRATSKTLSVEIVPAGCRVTAVVINHKSFNATVAQDSKHIEVSFDPEHWATGNGDPLMTVLTDCADERRIDVRLRVR